MGLVIKNFRSVLRGGLVGFASVHLVKSGVIVHDVKIVEGKDGVFAIAPHKPRLKNDGSPVLKAGGYAVEDPIVGFIDAKTRQLFSDAVIKALRKSNPEAFSDPAPAPEQEREAT